MGATTAGSNLSLGLHLFWSQHLHLCKGRKKKKSLSLLLFLLQSKAKAIILTKLNYLRKLYQDFLA